MNFLITGGASGLGKAITTAIAARYPDAKIYFTYFSSEQGAKDIEQKFPHTTAVRCDFSSKEDVSMLCKLVEEQTIDVLVNNALSQLQKVHFHKTDVTGFTDSFHTDVLSTLQITQAFISKARKNKFGKIITVLSASLINVPPVGWSTYTANKSYLLSMSKSWAAENNNFNITANCISPDFMATPLNNEVDERVVEAMVSKHPLKKLLTVEEVADTVLFICSATQHLNGQNIVLNAAQSM